MTTLKNVIFIQFDESDYEEYRFRQQMREVAIRLKKEYGKAIKLLAKEE